MTEAIDEASDGSRVLAHDDADAESQWPRMWPRSSEPGCSHPLRTRRACSGNHWESLAFGIGGIGKQYLNSLTPGGWARPAFWRHA